MRNQKNWRYIQANKEALFTLVAYSVYFIWWYACAYGLGEGDPEQYQYVMGLPEWFFYSCIVGYPLITLALWAVVRVCFKEMPLDADANDDKGNVVGRSGDKPEGDEFSSLLPNTEEEGRS